MEQVQWSGNGVIDNTQCSNEGEVIENYKLAQVLADGIRQHYAELMYAEREYNNKLIEQKLKSDSVLKQLRELESIHGSYQKDIKALKWYQTEDRLKARQKAIFQEAKNIVGIENLTYHEAYYDYISEIKNEVATKIKNDLYLRDHYPSTSTILSILLLTPDFKNKSFKELIKVINNQTN